MMRFLSNESIPLFDASVITKYIKHCIEYFQTYETAYSFVGLPYDHTMHAFIEKCIVEKRKLSPTLLIVIGIGGSSLGARAVYAALKNSYQDDAILPILFLETVDDDVARMIFKKAEKELRQGKAILINVITKSGTTFETIKNFDIFLALLKQYRPVDYQALIVVTTDHNSALFHQAGQEHFTILTIPKHVGGRFSVFTAVGLFPLGLAGFDTKKLCEGARNITDVYSKNDLANLAAQSAFLQYSYYKKSFFLFDLFLFSSELEDLGKWCRQLFSESLGKDLDMHGNRIDVEIFFTVSLGSTDLHSVAQLYLAQAKHMFTTFVVLEQTNHFYDKNFLLMIAQATQKAYAKKNKPFCTITISQKNEYSLGQFLQSKMLEVVYLAKLLQVNAFDQPHVELYKKEMQTSP